MKLSTVVAALILSLPAPGPALAYDLVFSPMRFFSGGTDGVGQLTILFSRAHSVRVRGSGHVEANGTLVLDQTVQREGEAPTKRQWRIRPVGNGRYEGTLSDASGPVTGEINGKHLHLAFPMKGGLQAEQWLDLLPSGNVALNHMVVRKWGIPVATLEETITRTR